MDSSKAARTEKRSTLKRKAQNRISQQCSRARRAVQKRQLESLEQTLKADEIVCGRCGGSDTYTSLLRVHRQLQRDHHELENALVRLRQRLLSMNNMMVNAAEDPVYRKIFSISKDISKAKSPMSGTCDDRDVLRNASTRSERINTFDFASTNGSAENDQYESAAARAVYDFDPVIDEFATGDLGLQQLAPLPFVGTTGTIDAPEEGAIKALPTEGSMLLADIKIEDTITSSWIFAERVIAVCKLQLAKDISAEVTGRTTTARHMPLEQHEAAVSSVAKRLAKAAVHLIGALAGLQEFIYHTDFYQGLESVVCWQLCRTELNLAAVPEPLQPTPCQLRTAIYPGVIDFIFWPEIRDQMIRLCHELDLDALCHDIVLHTVVEIPCFKVAIPVYDLIRYKHSLTRLSSSGTFADSCLQNPNWTFVRVQPENPIFYYSCAPAEEFLGGELRKHLGSVSASSASDQPYFPVEFDDTNALHSIPCNFLGANKVENWKLDKRFCQRWPSLDCESVASTYTVVHDFHDALFSPLG